MSAARDELMRALYAALMADAVLDGALAGDKVFDHVPRGAAYPFVSFGDWASRELDGDNEQVERHRFEIMVHSRKPGRQEASGIADRVAVVLQGQSLPMSGFRLDGLSLRDTQVAASRDRRAYRVRLRFDAVTEVD